MITKRFEARYDGTIWSAGRMVDVGDVIGAFDAREEAEHACKDYEMNDFDRDHIYTSVDEIEG